MNQIKGTDPDNGIFEVDGIFIVFVKGIERGLFPGGADGLCPSRAGLIYKYWLEHAK